MRTVWVLGQQRRRRGRAHHRSGLLTAFTGRKACLYQRLALPASPSRERTWPAQTAAGTAIAWLATISAGSRLWLTQSSCSGPKAISDRIQQGGARSEQVDSVSPGVVWGPESCYACHHPTGIYLSSRVWSCQPFVSWWAPEPLLLSAC